MTADVAGGEHPESHAVAFSTAIEALRRVGAEQVNPVEFYYLDALAKRSRQENAAVQRILGARLTLRLARFTAALAQMQAAAGPGIAPDAANETPPSPLTGLIDYIDRQALANADAAPLDADDVSSPAELKALRYFRSTWSRLSTHQQVAHAIEQAPNNAGPLNSHHLVLQSLALLREIAPAYLEYFMSSVDTLLWLDEAEPKSKPAGKKRAKVRTVR